MMGDKRRKPAPHHREPAISKASNAIIAEIAGTVLAGLIFAVSVWTSVIGMAGALDHQEAIVVAEVGDGR